MKRLRHRFYEENLRALDSETINIIDRDQLSDQLADTADHVIDHPATISSVSEQAASIRQNGKSAPYTLASGSALNGKPR